MKHFTFEEYRLALEGAGPKLKEMILERAAQETEAWQRAAAGLMMMALLTNMALWALVCRVQAERTAETARLRDQLDRAEAVRDQAVRELGALALETAREKEARAEQAAAYEAAGAWEYIGECTVTAYCPCETCCGRWADGLTASGLPAGPGVVAVDPEVIPLGSTVVVDGQRYLAADTGVTGDHVDICMPDHAAAEDFGVQRMDVWVAVPGTAPSSAG